MSGTGQSPGSELGCEDRDRFRGQVRFSPARFQFSSQGLLYKVRDKV